MLPQFIDRGAEHVPVEMLVLEAVFLAIALVSDSIWASAPGYARSRFQRAPRLTTMRAETT